ncbi:MAG: class I SAM-dependent methyltransferase [Theionarchaea archaeon]|nr:class I SAM-dependent methyltransferase [Theionarchaea archaeon]
MLGGHPLAPIDYKGTPIPRYDLAQPHPVLYKIINQKRAVYRKTLEQFLSFKEYFFSIGLNNSNSYEPSWNNKWFSGLDSVALCSFLLLNNPRNYYEIGSGWSTKFARKTIADYGLQTEITSFDPAPREQIDELCDRPVRTYLQDTDLALFNELQEGDILFIDGSHQCFMNSDVTVIFLDILPRLKANIFVEFHDVFLPYDYDTRLRNRFYNEQYLLAVSILSGFHMPDIVLPNAFISRDTELRSVLAPLWEEPRMHEVRSRGSSFWIRNMYDFRFPIEEAGGKLI